MLTSPSGELLPSDLLVLVLVKLSLVRDINVVDGSHDLGDLGLEYGVIKMNGFVGLGGEDEVFCGFARDEKLLRYIEQFVGSDELDTFSEMYLLRQTFLLALSPFRSRDIFDGAGT